MLNHIDDAILANLVTIAQAGTVTNSDENTATLEEINDMEGSFETTGTPREVMMYVAHPRAVGRLRTIDSGAFIPVFRGSEEGRLGISDVSQFNGLDLVIQASSDLLARAGNDVPAMLRVDRRKSFFATQAAPMVRVVPDPESGGDVLQIRSVYGFHTTVGSAVMALSGRADHDG